jgi:hypothetical protein
MTGTFEIDHNLFNLNQPDAGDARLYVFYYQGVLQNEHKTIAEGRPIFDDVECIRIIVPGDKNSVIDRPATMADKRRFSKQYEMFKAGKSEDAQTDGTPLTEWPFLSRGQVEELKYLGIRTVEHIAECRDDIATRVNGMHALKRNAQVWLGKSKSAAEASKTAKLIDDQQAQIAALQEAVRDQSKRLQDALAAKA